MKKRKIIFKRVSYLLMIISLITVVFSAPTFIEKEVNAVEEESIKSVLPEEGSIKSIVTIPIITRGNWTLAQQYVFTTNEPIIKYSLDGGNFIAIDPPVDGEYTIAISDNLQHQLVLKDADSDVSEAYPIEAKATGNDNLMFYASKGLLPWDNDANWQFNGAGATTPDIFDANGNCKQEYGEGAACYKIYDLDVDGEQVKVLQQLDDSSTAILQTLKLLDQNDYNNLYSNGGSVSGRVIVPSGDTYAGGNPNTAHYAGNSQALNYGAFVGLQFDAEMIPGSSAKRRYGLSITYSGEYVKISTTEWSRILNGITFLNTETSQAEYLPPVKVGDPLDFEIRIPGTAGTIGELPQVKIFVNGICVGQIQSSFNTFGGGSRGSKVIISSGSTGGTNRALLIENFGLLINSGNIDVLAPVSGGSNTVNNPTYTFKSNEEVSGYQVNYKEWITVTPNYQITDIHLGSGLNNLRVRDISGNIATYQVQYADITIPTINPINVVVVEDISIWTAPEATATDDADGDISNDVVITYYKNDITTSINLTEAREELVAGRSVNVKYNVSDVAGNRATEVSAIFRSTTVGIPTITRGNWTLTQHYIFTTNETVVEYSLDGGNFIAIDAIGGEYTITIGDDLLHQLVLKDADNDVSDAFPIEAKSTGNNNLIFYASNGLLPWDNDSNWEYGGTPDIFDADGNCKNEYGEGAVCYKIYKLAVEGEQVKVLQQLDDSSTVILQTVRQLNQNDYNNLYRNGGSVRGRVILPTIDTYAGLRDPNVTTNIGYAGNSQGIENGAFVGLQFESEMIPGSDANRRYGLNITNLRKHMRIITNGERIALNGDTDVSAIGDSQTVNLPEVKVGDPLNFEIRIPGTAGAIGILPKAEIYVNGVYIGKTNFNTFGAGATDSKVTISSGSTGGTNRAIIIEKFGSLINTGDIDILAPVYGGASTVNNSIHTFESNEKVSGYQVNDKPWITVEPNYQTTDINLSSGKNNLRVRDISGNIATYIIDVDENAPVIVPVDPKIFDMEDAATWEAPETTAYDSEDGDISTDIVVTYYKFVDIWGPLAPTTLAIARTELENYRDVIVKYTVSDNAGNDAEVSALFSTDNEPPVMSPVADATVDAEDISEWCIPIPSVTDNRVGITIIMIIYKSDGITAIDLTTAREELATGKSVTVQYFAYDRIGNHSEISATFTAVTPDTRIPVIDPVDDATVNIGDASSWTTPKPIAMDGAVDISNRLDIKYYTEDGTPLLDEEAARTELGAGNKVIVKYNVTDATGNKAVEVSATFTAVTPDTTVPVIDQVDDADVNIGDASSWITPEPIAMDGAVDISDRLDIKYYTEDGTPLLDEEAARAELAEAGNKVIVKYNVSDAAGNDAVEVIATFTAVTSDTTPPVITSSGMSRTFEYTITANENISWYSIDNGATWTQVTTPSDNVTITFPANGIYQIIVKDVAENESAMKSVKCSA